MILFQHKKYEELTLKEAHDIFAIRSEVFVVEQDCVYQDIDGKDPKALHIIGTHESKNIAYARIFDKNIIYNNHIAIGRILVCKEKRSQQIGHDLVDYCLKTIKNNFTKSPIKISAQAHLELFYNHHGFQKKGDDYLEDGIPHISMFIE